MTELNSKEILLKEIEKLRSELAAALETKDVRTTQLFNSEERFALAMRGASDGLWDWNMATDEVYYSPRWKSMLGYDEHELENNLSSWTNLVHPEDNPYVLNEVQKLLSGEVDSFEVEMRMHHKMGHEVYIRSRGFKVIRNSNSEPVRLIGTHVDITLQKKAELFDARNSKILEMIAKGDPAPDVYNEIALMYEERHLGLRCSMLELDGRKLLHGGAPSLPKTYCEAVHGLINGPEVGSCGASSYTGKRVLVEDIAVDPKWKDLKHVALPFGMRSCWSEPIKSSSGNVLGAFGMYHDYPALPNNEELNDLKSAARLASIVMDREHNQKRIRDLAYTDELTSLSSRTHFYLNVEELIKISARDKKKFGLLYIDLDNFKNVNDTFGHDMGDLLLINVAQRLKAACREIDYIARLSGDEFCIAINDEVDEYGAAHVAKRCLELVSKPLELAGRSFTPACSIGIAHYPDNGIDLNTILKAADTALYYAKDLGKNRYAFYDTGLTQKAEYRFKIEQSLREAIDNQQLTVVYQPKVDMTTGCIVSVEALSRWDHPKLGYISPVDFIRMAEQIGMIKELTEWVLKTACQQIALWKNAGYSSIRMAVNISPSHFLDSDFLPLIERIIKDTGITPGDLELEVSEGVVQNNEENLNVFKYLNELGVLLAIDDFGVGYSSLASLKHLSIDFLKIDKYFIDDMLVDNKAKLLVSSMIEMGHNMGHQVTAEGVEKEEQFEMLQSLGCDSAQGYLFSKPTTAEQILMLLGKKLTM
ncbi:MAG: diguanylate cyclase (GGDEF)-like protein/PAS domain S-box-containing protein [Colwellia sp.]|jgi:diguanylate cyclase (GGDEF)-like protein/PAS domain S-box-containing protein